jgi:hypothetical protein
MALAALVIAQPAAASVAQARAATSLDESEELGGSFLVPILVIIGVTSLLASIGAIDFGDDDDDLPTSP